MRKLGAGVLAVPVLMAVYLASLGRRGLAHRFVAGIASAAVIAAVVVLSTPPAPSIAVPQSVPAPVSGDLFMTIERSHPVTAAFTIGFDAPMDAASVANALSIRPVTPYTIDWDAAHRLLTVSPRTHWLPGTLYRVEVAASARGANGGALDAPVRNLVLTSRGGSGDIAASRPHEQRVRLDTTFTIRLDRPMPLAAVRAALRSAPPVAGDLVEGATPGTFILRPYADLAPDTRYRIVLAGLVDADGVAFEAAPGLAVRTVALPVVERFRPSAGGGRVDRGTTFSVRFSVPMEKARTGKAIHVTIDGKRIPGAISWAEDATVAVFEPSSALPYDTYVTISVDLSARSRAGASIAGQATTTIRVAPKPAPVPSATTAIPTGGAGAVSGNWLAVERYYLRLMNCTRTGGWVTSTGACSSPGGRAVAPLALSAGISSQVSRPYAKLLATRNECNHFIGGNPGDRLRRAGYTSYRWAENLGCRSGGAYSSVLGSHLFFQAEKPYNGGHYRNLMNADYDRAGIGVWVAGGRVRLVVDLYHP